jgi:hypothetical protein
MAQALEYAKQVMEQRAGLFGYTTPDEVAWIYNTATNVVLKANKYRRGDIYRQLVQAASPVYRATKGDKSGLDAYSHWYGIGPKALQAVRNALAVIQAAGVTR